MAECAAKQAIPKRFKTFNRFLEELGKEKEIYQSQAKRIVGSKQWYKTVKSEIMLWNSIFETEHGHPLITFKRNQRGRRSNEVLCALHPRVKDLYERSPTYFLVLLDGGEDHDGNEEST